MQTEAIFENIAERIQSEINNAQKSIFIAVAWFTNKTLFDALLKKAKNGCTVSLIVSNDEINSNSKINYESLNINQSKIYKVGNGNTELMHNKFCVIDYCTVITGSYNWSYKAEKNNFENVIITIDDTSLAEQFIIEFNKIRQQYFPSETTNEIVFPINTIVKRLEILKNHILLEDIEELNSQLFKLKEFDFNTDLKEIILDIKQKEYASGIKKIQEFISRHQQLAVWNDPEIMALKLEIKILENKANAYDNEKTELDKLLSNFQHRHTLELSDVILEILRLRKILHKSKDAEQDENEYRQQVKNDKQKEVFDLSDEQKIELKKKFRKATMLCHPDKVADELKDEAQKVFIDLKEAYDRNDLNQIITILNELEKGNIFKAMSDTISEKEQLLSAILKLKKQIENLQTEIISIKQSDSYQTVSSIDDWNKYFEITKEKLQEELKSLITESETI